MVMDLHTSCQYRLDGLGGMVTYLGLAYILPNGFDVDRLDGLGGWGGGW